MLLATSVIFAEFRYQDYKPDSIARALSDNPHDPSVDLSINAGRFKYRVRVAFPGERRKLPPEIKNFINNWAKALGHGSAIADLFQHEILVREGGANHWLPIQEPLLPALDSEVKAGGLVDLYIMHAGSTKSRQVFLVNEFQALGSSP